MRINSADFALIASIVVHEDIESLSLKSQLSERFSQLKHITLEVHRCDLTECG